MYTSEGRTREGDRKNPRGTGMSYRGTEGAVPIVIQRVTAVLHTPRTSGDSSHRREDAV
jgi:hypothetical protein